MEGEEDSLLDYWIFLTQKDYVTLLKTRFTPHTFYTHVTLKPDHCYEYGLSNCPMTWNMFIEIGFRITTDLKFQLTFLSNQFHWT